MDDVTRGMLRKGLLKISQQTYAEDLAVEYGIEWGKATHSDSCRYEACLKNKIFMRMKWGLSVPGVGRIADGVVGPSNQAIYLQRNKNSSGIAPLPSKCTLGGCNWYFRTCVPPTLRSSHR